jgi:hypothetical protein
MRGKLLIGLVGPANSGKDMVALYLTKHKNFKRFAFADRIKKEYFANAGDSEEKFKAARGTPEEEEMRRGLWNYSDRIRREKGDLHFVNLVMADMAACSGNAVITDIRTPDELAAVRRAGGIIALIVRHDLISPADDARIPDSRLTFGDLSSEDLVFRNTGDGLALAHRKLDMFYRECVLEETNDKLEGDMDADSGPTQLNPDTSRGSPP